MACTWTGRLLCSRIGSGVICHQYFHCIISLSLSIWRLNPGPHRCKCSYLWAMSPALCYSFWFTVLLSCSGWPWTPAWASWIAGIESMCPKECSPSGNQDGYWHQPFPSLATSMVCIGHKLLPLCYWAVIGSWNANLINVLIYWWIPHWTRSSGGEAWLEEVGCADTVRGGSIWYLALSCVFFSLFPYTMKWASLPCCIFPANMLCHTTHWSSSINRATWPWTTTSETVSQNQSFLACNLCLVICHSSGRWLTQQPLQQQALCSVVPGTKGSGRTKFGLFSGQDLPWTTSYDPDNRVPCVGLS